MLLKYRHNNSGGHWWLSDEDWYNLEKNGWRIEWYKDGDRVSIKNNRFLGALAARAEKEFNTLEDGIKEWEDITKSDATDEGCSCCGRPHYFELYDGEKLIDYNL